MRKVQGIYKRELNSSYFIVEEQAMEGTQYYQMKMVTENKISHLLPVTIHHFNGENQFYYDISGKQTLACIFEKREIEAGQLVQILFGLSKALTELENYLLDENYLCLQPEYMYMNVNTEQLFLCFYPFEETDFCRNIQKLSEYLLNHINHQDEQTVNMGYQLYRLTRDDNFVFLQIAGEILQENEHSEKEEFYEKSMNEGNARENRSESSATDMLRRQWETEEGEEECKPQKKGSSVSIREFKIPALCFLFLILGGGGYILYQYMSGQQEGAASLSVFLGTRDMILAAGAAFVGLAGFFLLFLYKRILERGKVNETEERENMEKQMEREYFAIRERAYEEEQAPFEDMVEEMPEKPLKYEETVLLQENMYKEEGILVEKLKRFDKKPPVKIVLNNFPFMIGKLEGAVDYVLSDKSVSRMHAKFIKNPNEDMVYLMDLNSKNGTLKNGIPLEANELVPLTAEDEITFGKVTFTYH